MSAAGESLRELNSLPRPEAIAELQKCCGSLRWAEGMAAARPFATPEALQAAAKEIWWGLSGEDWLEAFRHHPKIGAKRAAAAAPQTAQKWSQREQAGTQSAAQEILAALQRANEEYERRFGFIFIVCASGKSAGEMLEILRSRLDNAPEDELRIAAAEQTKITHLRLEKLLDA